MVTKKQIYIDTELSNFVPTAKEYTAGVGTKEYKIVLRCYDKTGSLNIGGTTYSNIESRFELVLNGTRVIGTLYCTDNILKHGKASGDGSYPWAVVLVSDYVLSDGNGVQSAYADPSKITIPLTVPENPSSIGFKFVPNVSIIPNYKEILASDDNYEWGGSLSCFTFPFSQAPIVPNGKRYFPGGASLLTQKGFGVYYAPKPYAIGQYQLNSSGNWLSFMPSGVFAKITTNPADVLKISNQQSHDGDPDWGEDAYNVLIEKQTGTGWNNAVDGLISSGADYEVISSSGLVDQGNGLWTERGILEIKLSTNNFRFTVTTYANQDKITVTQIMEVQCADGQIITYEVIAPTFSVYLAPTNDINNIIDPSNLAADLVALGKVSVKCVPQLNKTNAYIKKTVTWESTGEVESSVFELSATSPDEQWINRLPSFMKIECNVKGKSDNQIKETKDGFGSLTYNSAGNILIDASEGNTFDLLPNSYKVGFDLNKI